MEQRVFDERYEVLRSLGAGGMAEVFLVRDRLLDREVALKLLRSQHAGSEESVERFGREAKSAAALSHPNIVRVFGAGSLQDGTPYMTMEHLSGGTLKDRLSVRGALPARTAAEVAVQISRAVQAAHESELIHRDIKPQNILITAGGDVKVADFGIARAAEATAMTQTSHMLGTVHYLSPEQARGEELGPQSDLYSLGVTLYEMLTGEVPFDAESPIAVAMRHVSDPPPSPAARNPEVPEYLDFLTMKLLSKEPEDRHASADELTTDLRRFLEEPTVEFTARMPYVPSGASGEARSGRRRRRRVAGAAAALCVVAVVPLAAATALSEERFPASMGFLGWPSQPQSVESFAEVRVPEKTQLTAPAVSEVPDLSGMNLSAAEAALSKADLQTGEVTHRVSETVPAEDIISQQPAPGDTVEEGSAVDLQTSSGPPAPPPQPAPEPTSESKPAPEPEPAPEPTTEPQPVPEPTSESEPALDPQPAPEPTTESQPEPEPQQPAPETTSETQPTPEPEPAPEPTTEPQQPETQPQQTERERTQRPERQRASQPQKPGPRQTERERTQRPDEQTSRPQQLADEGLPDASEIIQETFDEVSSGQKQDTRKADSKADQDEGQDEGLFPDEGPVEIDPFGDDPGDGDSESARDR